MTSAEAQSLQTRITASDAWLMWFVIAQPSGTFVARGIVADSGGGRQEGDDLVADTIDELRAMLPPGLTRRDRTMMMMRDVVETWD